MDFRLEFNEERQRFHLDLFRNKENTNGFVTIVGKCTDVEFWIYESFVNRVPKDKLTKEYVLECVIEVNGFLKNLNEYGLVITNKK